MQQNDTDTELRRELEELLQATLALTKTLNAQKRQISGMMEVFETLLAHPDFVLKRRDVFVKFVDACRNHTPGLDASPPRLQLN